MHHLVSLFREHPPAENRAFVQRWKARYGEASSPSVDGQSAYVGVYLLARALRRAGTSNIGEVRRAAAGYRYNSPQGPVWIDGDNNHCVLTPRLAVSNAQGQFASSGKPRRPSGQIPI